jgi:hypothetical protein
VRIGGPIIQVAVIGYITGMLEMILGKIFTILVAAGVRAKNKEEGKNQMPGMFQMLYFYW